MAFFLAKLLLACYVASASAELEDASILLQTKVEESASQPVFQSNPGPADLFPTGANPDNVPFQPREPPQSTAGSRFPTKQAVKQAIDAKGIVGIAKDAKVGSKFKQAVAKAGDLAKRAKQIVAPTVDDFKGYKNMQIEVQRQKNSLQRIEQEEMLDASMSDNRLKASTEAREAAEREEEDMVQATLKAQQAQDKVAPFRSESEADQLAKSAAADALAAAPAQQVMAAMSLQKAAQEAQAAALEQEARNNMAFSQYLKQMQVQQATRQKAFAADRVNTMAHLGEFGVFQNNEDRQSGEWSALNPMGTKYELAEAMAHQYKVD